MQLGETLLPLDGGRLSLKSHSSGKYNFNLNRWANLGGRRFKYGFEQLTVHKSNPENVTQSHDFEAHGECKIRILADRKYENLRAEGRILS